MFRDVCFCVGTQNNISAAVGSPSKVTQEERKYTRDDSMDK